MRRTDDVSRLVTTRLEPGQTVAHAAGAYYGTGVLMDELGRWGVRHVEFDQTGPPPEGVDLEPARSPGRLDSSCVSGERRDIRVSRPGPAEGGDDEGALDLHGGHPT